MCKRLAAAGFTIIEVVVTIATLSIALLGVVYIVRIGTAETADTMLEARAFALAQAYLDEIAGRRFDEQSPRNGINPCFGLPVDTPPKPCTAEANFGPDMGESGGFARGKFDDVDDYHEWEEGDGVAGEPIRDAEGDERLEYPNFHVLIEVSYAGDDSSWAGNDPTHAKLVVVTVRHRAQAEGWKFSMYKGNY